MTRRSPFFQPVLTLIHILIFKNIWRFDVNNSKFERKNDFNFANVC